MAPISLILLSLGCQDSVQVLDLHLTILEFFLQSHEFHPLLFRHIHLRENSVGWNKETNKWMILRGAQFPCSEAAKAVFLWGTRPFAGALSHSCPSLASTAQRALRAAGSAASDQLSSAKKLGVPCTGNLKRSTVIHAHIPAQLEHVRRHALLMMISGSPSKASCFSESADSRV